MKNKVLQSICGRVLLEIDFDVLPSNICFFLLSISFTYHQMCTINIYFVCIEHGIGNDSDSERTNLDLKYIFRERNNIYIHLAFYCFLKITIQIH